MENNEKATETTPNVDVAKIQDEKIEALSKQIALLQETLAKQTKLYQEQPMTQQQPKQEEAQQEEFNWKEYYF